MRNNLGSLRRSAVLIVASGIAVVAVSSVAGANPQVGSVPLSVAPTVVAGGATSTTTTFPTSSIGIAGAGATKQSDGRPVGQSSGTVLNGTGSSFAAPAIETFDSIVQQQPYNLSVNYSSTSSGDGRYEFTNGTTNFAVSDIAYGLGNTDTIPPDFPFIYVPITAGGIAFMYNIPGLTKTLQMNSYTTCAILTGGITNWDNSAIAAINPGVKLPNLAIVPVTESDPAGTNYVLEEWCIDEQPALWAAFANAENANPANQVTISPTHPESEWPGLANGLDTDSTAGVASDVSTNAGAIGGVQLQYAVDAGFDKGNPAQGVASEYNASGDYVQPTSVDVASALAYATQLPNGTHQLNFGGIGPHVYNPSTYSYLLTPTSGWQSSLGAVLSAFVNYSLTLGQEKSPSFGYAGLGLSLERYGIDSVTADVPGAVPVTSAEQAGYACGDLTPSEVAAGQTTPTCGVTDATAPIPPKSGEQSVGSSGSSGSGGSGGSGGSSASSSSSGYGGSGSGGGVDPAVSLSGSVPLAFTGGDPRPVVLVGLLLLVTGWWARRRLLRSRRVEVQR
ncbi:MAG: substrate-binding domain-containing protein [Acidimicrobiales bacterium]|jgi:ABC-type phosphate transport system substrate-binding protein